MDLFALAIFAVFAAEPAIPDSWKEAAEGVYVDPSAVEITDAADLGKENPYIAACAGVAMTTGASQGRRIRMTARVNVWPRPGTDDLQTSLANIAIEHEGGHKSSIAFESMLAPDSAEHQLAESLKSAGKLIFSACHEPGAKLAQPTQAAARPVSPSSRVGPDYFPAESQRKGETGAAIVRACIDVSGHLMGEPIVTESSGSERLDAGAIRLAKAGDSHYKPALQGGKPIPSCFVFRVSFKLQGPAGK